MNARFFKYQAFGNDMLIIDPHKFDFPLTPAIVRLICDRHYGLGADGICYGPLPIETTAFPAMRFLNPDGSESAKSGNGLRVFARYLWDYGYVTGQEFKVLINNETIRASVIDKSARTIKIEMGRLSFCSSDIPVSGPVRDVIGETITVQGIDHQISAVTIGNPHCVIFDENVSAASARALGPLIETRPDFPNRTNVQLVHVLDRHLIRIEIWERGAGYTLASGTSASAAAGVAVRVGRCDSPVTVQMAGGTALVSIDEVWQVMLTGEVEAVGQGSFADDLIARFA